MKQKDSSVFRELALMVRVRREYAIKVGLTFGLGSFVLGYTLVIVWGNDVATFFIVVCTIFHLREWLKAYLFWRWMKDEEKRVRCLALLVAEGKGEGDGC